MKYIKFTFCILVIALSIVAIPYIKVHAEQKNESNPSRELVSETSVKPLSTTVHHVTKKIIKKKKVSKKKVAKKVVVKSTTATAPTSTLPSYSLADVSVHNSKSSCWTIINGNVYDLTKWIAQHPGGEGAILSICGKNGSSAFDNQHGTSGRSEQILKTFQIGIAK